jgi:hypothetical protein
MTAFGSLAWQALVAWPGGVEIVQACSELRGMGWWSGDCESLWIPSMADLGAWAWWRL